VSYWVTSLELECTFSGQGRKRSVCIGFKFLVEFLAWENSSQKVTNVILNLPPNGGSPGNHTISTPTCNWLQSKKIQSSVLNNTLLCFGAITPSSEPPFLSRIARTVGTLSCKSISRAFRFLGWESWCVYVYDHLRSFVQGSCALQCTDNRIWCQPIWSSQWYLHTIVF
jgi:hypothetical protein